MSLKQKHALITGSSRGIGRGIALKLAEAGATIAIHYYQNEAAAKATLRRIKERGADGAIFQADVTKHEQVDRLFKEVRSRFPSLDTFVRNARPEAVHCLAPRVCPKTDSRLASTRLDTNASTWNAGGRWRCRHSLLFSAGELDHRSGNICRWRCFVDEPGSAARDPTRLVGNNFKDRAWNAIRQAESDRGILS